MAYQDTPRASKGNAFCWTTWQPRIDWKARPQNEALYRGRQTQIEAARDAGVDPLHIGGLSSAARQHPLDPARFALAAIQKGARHAR